MTESDSADQDFWTELTDAIRGELSRRGRTMQQMTMEDLHTYIIACRDACNLEINAKSFDKKLSKAQTYGE